MSEVSYFNGCSVTQEQIEYNCWVATCKIELYLNGIERRELKKYGGAT